jgi:hypothetical protein
MNCAFAVGQQQVHVKLNCGQWAHGMHIIYKHLSFAILKVKQQVI